MKDTVERLNHLGLTTVARQWPAVLADASAQSLSLDQWVNRLLDLEIEGRQKRAVERRFRESHLRVRIDIDGFDFNHHKSRQQIKTRVLRLLDLDFLDQGVNVVLIGNPGTGKTFLARILGWRACRANRRVLFTSAMDMLNQLLASQVDLSLVRKLRTYTAPTLLICDELGYLSLDQQTSNLFYQVISARHAAGRSTILTTNTPFSEWSNILHDARSATAIADRLVENSEIFLLGGESLRKAKKSRALAEEVQA